MDFKWLRDRLSAKIFLEHKVMQAAPAQSTASPRKKKVTAQNPAQGSAGSAAVAISDEDMARPVQAAHTLLKEMQDFHSRGEVMYEVLHCALIKNVVELRSINDVHWSPKQLEALARVSDRVFGLRSSGVARRSG